MKLLTHKEYGGLYDFNEKTKELSAILKCYGENDVPQYYKLTYEYYEQDYRYATNEDIEEYKYEYYNEKGSQPLVKL